MTEMSIQAAKSAYKYPLLIKQLWHTPLVQAPDQVIVYRDLKRFTYRQMRERIGRLASSLAGLGVGAGDTVGVLDWDSNRFLEAYFAVPMMGAVLQTVNVRLPPEQIAYTINHAGSSVLLVNDEFVPTLEGIKNQLPKVKRLVVMSDKPAPQTGGLAFAGEYEDLLLGASPDYDFPDFDENTLATTFYTTGTTGSPKGVYFSHRQLVLHSLAEMAFFGSAAKQGRFCRDDVYMPITPMFHAHAWGFPWTATLSGVKQVYPGRYDPALLLKLIKTEGVTFTHGVPTILQMLLGAATAANTDLAGLKMLIGGSELPKGLARQALALGVDVFAGYGMSESAPLLSVAQVKSADLIGDPEKAVDIRTKAGIPVPLVDIRLVDTDLHEVPHDGRTPGEVVVRAPWLTQGYVDNPEASEQLWAGGYLHTNDIGVIEPERLPSYHRPHQGRHQDRRRMGVIAADRRPHIAVQGSVGSRRHRRQGRQMGRATPGAHRPQRPGGRRSQRHADQGASARFRRCRRDFENRNPGPDPVCQNARQDERRKVRQEGAPGEIRHGLDRFR